MELLNRLHYYNVLFALALLALISGCVPAFSFNNNLRPSTKPELVQVQLIAKNKSAKAQLDKFKQLLYKELTLHDFKVIEDEGHEPTISPVKLKLNYSVHHDLIWKAYTSDHFSNSSASGYTQHYVDGISRIAATAEYFDCDTPKPFLEISIALDTEVIGASTSGYESVESFDSVLNKAASFLSEIIHASLADDVDLVGVWNDPIGEAEISFEVNSNNNGYIGVAKRLDAGSFGFSQGDVCHKIYRSGMNKEELKGELKVSYLTGGSKWIPT